MTKESTNEPGTMFVSGSGRSFNTSTLVQWWKKVMEDTSTMEYFPPGKARNIFCTEFHRKHGHQPDIEEGCAAVMGNTPEQWGASYLLDKKRRLSQAAANIVAGDAESDSDEQPMYFPRTPMHQG